MCSRRDFFKTSSTFDIKRTTTFYCNLRQVKANRKEFRFLFFIVWHGKIRSLNISTFCNPITTEYNVWRCNLSRFSTRCSRPFSFLKIWEFLTIRLFRDHLVDDESYFSGNFSRGRALEIFEVTKPSVQSKIGNVVFCK